MRNLWQMLAHVNGQVVNYSMLANSLGVTANTVKKYINLLTDTYMLYTLSPYIKNVKKRIVKASKVYLADNGVCNTLSQINTSSQMFGHPGFGSLWEGMVLMNLKSAFPEADICFYRTSHGAEIDFIIDFQSKVFAVECKASKAPSLTKGNYNAIEDIKADKTFIAAPIEQGWSLSSGIDIVNLSELILSIQEYRN